MKGVRTLIAAPSAGRMETMSQLLRTGGLSVEEFPDWQTFLDADSALGIAAAPLFSGAVFHHPEIVILSEAELYAASPRRHRLRRVKHATTLEMMVRDVAELKPGDAVVHADHGIGRYQGLVHMERRTATRNFWRSPIRTTPNFSCPLPICSSSRAMPALIRSMRRSINWGAAIGKGQAQGRAGSS